MNLTVIGVLLYVSFVMCIDPPLCVLANVWRHDRRIWRHKVVIEDMAKTFTHQPSVTLTRVGTDEP